MLDKFKLEEHVEGSHHFIGIFPREKMEEKGLDSYCLWWTKWSRVSNSSVQNEGSPDTNNRLDTGLGEPT